MADVTDAVWDGFDGDFSTPAVLGPQVEISPTGADCHVFVQEIPPTSISRKALTGFIVGD